MGPGPDRAPPASAARGWSRQPETLLDGPASLLDAMGCDTLAELDLVLYGAFELDPSVVEAGPRHVVVAVRDRGVEVRFPCTLKQFWESVTSLEWEARRRLEEASWEDG